MGGLPGGGQAIKVCFSNHTYEFNGEVYLQLDWGPISLRLTAAVARLVCLWFDWKFKALCAALGITLLMYARFIDDINLSSISIPLNLTYDPVNKSLIECEMKERENDEHTMDVMRLIAYLSPTCCCAQL